MFSVCMLAKKESKEKLYSWGLFQWQSFTLAGVYVYAHMWLHHPHMERTLSQKSGDMHVSFFSFLVLFSHLQNGE